MNVEPSKYWFSAKRYGWGWGPPLTWQGWAVLVPWTLIAVVGAAVILPQGLVAFLVFICFMTAALVAVCYLKGEPPRWRWGK
jgi:hypothetical protein